LAYLGVRPRWDLNSNRVTGVDVLPLAMLDRPRIDVTLRISGLFRDLFPLQIALLDRAAATIARLDEPTAKNPLRLATIGAGAAPPRIFGTAPGTYGAGIEERLAQGEWTDRAELGEAFLDAASHAFGGPEGVGHHAPGRFRDQVAAADLLVHTGDDPGRDLLEGSADVAFIGGFAAAAATLGRLPDLVALDTTDPGQPRARSLAEAIARVVRARAINPRFIEGQLRHGPRGAAEFAETVDRLIGFAETTGQVPDALIGAVHAAYLGDERVCDFIRRENPAALRAMAERFAAARRRGLWHPLRNAIDAELDELRTGVPA
jgi:cobaltochelatase CobN